jgi:MYXO-CTERM domain-containing protein
VSRNTVLWTLVIFFGASVMFGYIRNATEDESAATSLAAQAVAGLLLVAVIVLYVRRRR